MNTFQLQCFLAVAEHLNFTKAAEELHVTHPAVSQQIQSLEKELGAKLFQRSTRSVRITEAGRIFWDDARQIVAISNRARRRFDDAVAHPIETLALGCYNFPSMFLLTEALTKLHQERPALHPRLQMVPFQHIYRLLDEGDLDLVAGLKEADARRIHAAYRELFQTPVVCFMPADHLLAAQAVVTIEALRQERLVLATPPRTAAPVVQIQGELVKDKPLSELYFCESVEAMSVLVNAGYGVSLLPEFLVPDLPQLTCRPVEGVPPASFGVYYKSLDDRPLLRAFLRCASACFAEADD